MKAKQVFKKCEWKENVDVVGPVSLGRIRLKSWDRSMEGQ